ncbi:hypothetical protein BGZ83_000091 [Gryganskiella cystojenkinii]|nr:hypothetical protein BGZ83_000091 [Gryganskiella cystojenkinii]
MGAQWKREKVQDHKFDFINVDDFVDNSCWRQFRYTLVFVAIMRGILVYCSDIFTAVNLLANQNPSSFVSSKDGLAFAGVNLPYDVYKYLFTACILFGFVLLALEARRARNIVLSRDISYAFTSLMASRFYTVRSYPHYCFFSQINNSKKKVDDVAFFCFFTFRTWKRLILADAPRQFINATILWQTFNQPGVVKISDIILDPVRFFDWKNILHGSKDEVLLKEITLGAMLFTVLMFAFSLLSLILAFILYIPLVSHIQGNLKEYCCHKIDKRIEELIRRNTKNRVNAAQKAKNGKKDNIAMSNLQQPTLPQLDLLEDTSSKPLPAVTPRNPYSKAVAPSPYGGYGNSNNGGYGQDYDYNNDYNTSYNNNNGYGGDYGYSSKNDGYTPQTQGYTQNYSKDDYFQAKPVPSRSATTTTTSASTLVAKTPASAGGNIGYDPYTESPYADDIYDHYSGSQEHQHLQQSSSGQDVYGDYYNASPDATSNNKTNAYNQSSSQPQRPAVSSSRTRQYDDYGHPQRSGSPLPSQHGSDLDSNHYGYNNNGASRGSNNNSGGHGGYNNGSYNNSYHNSNDYYRSSSPAPGGNAQYQQQQSSYSPQTSPSQGPQRGRRQDTAQSQSRDRYRAGQGY